MLHPVLLGDSIFDNAAYVPDELPVIEQVRQQGSGTDIRASFYGKPSDFCTDCALA